MPHLMRFFFVQSAHEVLFFRPKSMKHETHSAAPAAQYIAVVQPAPVITPSATIYPPLELVNKPNLTTDEAAHYLNRAPQTLRIWAMRDGINGLRPRRIGGLLAWPTAEVKALALGVAA